MENTAIRSERSVGLPAASLLKQAALVVGGSAVIALCARLMLPLPYTPVPLTLANFGVLLVGLTWAAVADSPPRRFISDGAPWGCRSSPWRAQVAWLNCLGASGIPVGLSSGRVLAGWISERGVRSFGRNLLAATVAEVVLFVGGLSWLAILTHSWHQAAFFGLYPFFFAEVMKVMAAAARRTRHPPGSVS